MEHKEAMTTDERSSSDERPRPDEGLSTRDLASPNDRTTDAGEGDAATDVRSSGNTSTAAGPGAQASTQADTAQQDDALRRGDALAQVDAMPQDGAESQGDGPIEGAPSAGTSQAADPSGSEAPLVPTDMSATFQQRWKVIQTRFVDEPRGAVEDADGLVATLMQQLAEGFAKERERLEAQWDRGEDISTEDLRVALQRYRSFFQRLLST
jgi:hypothetical protein